MGSQFGALNSFFFWFAEEGHGGVNVMLVGRGGICEKVKGVGRKNDQNVCVGAG